MNTRGIPPRRRTRKPTIPGRVRPCVYKAPVPLTFTYKNQDYIARAGKVASWELREYEAANGHLLEWLAPTLNARPDLKADLVGVVGGDQLRPTLTNAINSDSRLRHDVEKASLVIEAVESLSPDRLSEIIRELVPEAGLTEPLVHPQQTFEEAKDTAIAISDHRDEHRRMEWRSISGEASFWRVFPNGLELKFVPSPHWPEGEGRSPESIFSVLSECDQRTVICFHFVLGTVIRHSGPPTIRLDDLLTQLRLVPRSAAQRSEMRTTVWRWLLVFDSMWVVGQRNGVYRDPLTKERLDLRSEDALVKITGLRRVQGESDDVAPIEVMLIAGPWLRRLRSYRHVLPNIGNIDKIARIAAGETRSGKVTRAWAQSIALALNQLWREQAARADVHRVGAERRLTVKFKPFTRRQLLSMFPPSPGVTTVLDSGHPKRAVGYWDGAMSALQREGFIRQPRELTSPPVPRQRGCPELR